ncbi:cupin domain-containing protein [Sedimenticola sp.]|uniref:cupin domain-containing protein n=1 Tax=Sedimenticola sp. TaxID=1940285 RepID=UPI003D135F29
MLSLHVDVWFVPIAARGRGELEMNGEVIPLGVNDVAHIGPMVVHQLRTVGDEPFGFYCIVDHLRDRPIKV